jgi:protease IV
MIPQPPPGQGPVDPQGAFAPPSAPGTPGGAPAAGGAAPAGYPNAAGPSGPYAAPNPAMSAGPSPSSPYPPGGPPAGGGWSPMQGAGMPGGPWMPPPQQRPGGPAPYGQPGPYGQPYPPPPGPPRRGGFGRSVFFLLLSLLLIPMIALSWLLVAGIFAAAFGPNPTDRIITTTVQDGDAQEEVAVIPLVGEIDESAARRIDRCLNRVQNAKNVKAVVLEIDSPGGTVTASDEIYRRIRRYKDDRADKGLPNQVVVSMKSMATSGGYYAACAGDYLYAEPTTLTGNIGVLMPRYNFSGLMQKYGVEETTVVSTGSKYKNAGSPFQPENERDKKYLQSLADAAFGQFKQVVKDGRGKKLTATPEDLFSGRVFVAQEAKDAGLVDNIGYPFDAYAYAAKLASLSKAKIVRYEEPPPSILNMVAQGRIPGTKAENSGATLNVNGVQVNAGPRTLDQFRTERLLYR